MGHSFVFQILWHSVMKTFIISGPPCLNNSARMLSAPDDLSPFSVRTASSTSSRQFLDVKSNTWACLVIIFFSLSFSVARSHVMVAAYVLRFSGDSRGNQPARDRCTTDYRICYILVHKEYNPILVFGFLSAVHGLCPSSVVVSPKPVHLTSVSRRLSHRYMDSSCVSSFTFPQAYRVRTFHVPMVVFSACSLMPPLDLTYHSVHYTLIEQ